MLINDQETFNTTDSQGASANCSRLSKQVWNLNLTVGTAQTVIWPAGYNFARIAGATAYWVNNNTTATVPAANDLSGNGSAYNPTLIKRGDADTQFSIITVAAQVVSVEFWK